MTNTVINVKNFTNAQTKVESSEINGESSNDEPVELAFQNDEKTQLFLPQEKAGPRFATVAMDFDKVIFHRLFFQSIDVGFVKSAKE